MPALVYPIAPIFCESALLLLMPAVASAQRSQLRVVYLMDPAGTAAFALPSERRLVLCTVLSRPDLCFQSTYSGGLEGSGPCVQPSASHKVPALHLPFEGPSCPAICPVICRAPFGA